MYLYIISDSSESVVKIGYSQDPSARLRSLQTGYPAVLRVYHSVAVPEDRVRLLERRLHQELSIYRTRGEWFRISAQQAALLLDHCVIRWVDDPLLD